MESTCEVIGWLLDERNRGQVLVREHSGEISRQPAPARSFGDFAIQTGAFRRGSPILDPLTMETIGYEMEQIAHPYVTAAM